MASSMTECFKRDHAAIKCCLRSSTSCIAVRYTLFCMTSQLCNLPDLNPYGDQSSGPVNCGIPRVIKAREGITSKHDAQVHCPAERQTYLSDATDHWQQSIVSTTVHHGTSCHLSSQTPDPSKSSFETASVIY